MDSDRIRAGLKTKSLGREIVILDEVDSTNRYAARLAAGGDLRGDTVILANHQTAGRGRMERAWHSDGGLCMTVVLQPEISAERLGPITLATGVGVASGMASLGCPVKIKYPNDILAGTKKLGGILSEVKVREKTFVFLGIGLNVSQESFPVDIADIAVSLKQVGIATEREAVASAVLNGLEPVLDLFMRSGFPAVRPYWLEMNGTLGKNVTVKHPAGTVQGRAINLDDGGALVVETADGIRRVDTGDFLFTVEA